MKLHMIDWGVIVAYAAVALFVGIYFARRASRGVDEFFLSGRTLPWWIAGTSMVATTFAADTPLVISGWIRNYGIWKNWLWWCLAIGGVFTVFVFSRWWRRGEVMTTAELAELRYGGRSASVLRGFLGLYHAGITNTLVLCWVLLAAAKIADVLLDIDKTWAIVGASSVALSYALLAGFWGVVMTDLLQFAAAMVGSIALAFIAWQAVGGSDAILSADAILARPEILDFAPAAGPGGIFDASFWTIPFAAFCVYLGVSWWAVDAVDGGGLVVQRIAASKDERHGMLAALWYNVAHYALRPWPWIVVALASLLVLPHVELTSPVSGTVVEDSRDAVVIEAEGGAGRRTVALVESEPGWRPLAQVTTGDKVSAGQVVAASDSERAYVVMMKKFLPIGLLGLVAASLLAAFMSTIDTHVNLAASYFVGDVYRRFLAPGRSDRHYVGAARVACLGIMAVAGVLAYYARSIGSLYEFFLAFLAGVGPVYVLRWLWWRVRATTEITAMIASSVAAVWLTLNSDGWSLGALSPSGELAPVGRTCLVALVSMAAALLSLLVTRTPDPKTLVPFYEKVRPFGAWGPVRRLANDTAEPREVVPALLGAASALALIYGLLFGTGAFLLQKGEVMLSALGAAALGAVGVSYALKRLR